MFYATGFYPNEFGRCNVRPVRVAPYKTLKAAVKAIERKGIQGYVKQVGHSIPVWQNVAKDSNARH